jgi:hydroxypyruvate reductase
MREDALAIFHAGLEAVEPAAAVQRNFKLNHDELEIAGRSYDLSKFGGIFVVGAGKAAAPMAQVIEEILGPRLSGGVINVKYGHGLPLKKIKVNEAAHPIPDEAGVRGTREIARLLEGAKEGDLVVALFSGGASPLLIFPAEDLTLKDKQETTRILLNCGATIQEMNAVRKHLSRVKGGRLAKLPRGAGLIGLFLSDVIGDDLASIGSGPTVPDPTTFADCLQVLERYGVRDDVPPAVERLLARGARGEVEETPKPGNEIFARVLNRVVANNALALAAARGRAKELGYRDLILSSSVDGETKEVAKVHVALAREILATENPIGRPACLLSGGETTVTVRGKGKGGRNQEFALAAALAMKGMDSVVIFSAGTDGTDGPTEAAGAFADGTTVARARQKGLEAESHLLQNDSYPLFESLGDLVVTGPTRTNVMDLRLVLVA